MWDTAFIIGGVFKESGLLAIGSDEKQKAISGHQNRAIQAGEIDINAVLEPAARSLGDERIRLMPCRRRAAGWSGFLFSLQRFSRRPPLRTSDQAHCPRWTLNSVWGTAAHRARSSCPPCRVAVEECEGKKRMVDGWVLLVEGRWLRDSRCPASPCVGKQTEMAAEKSQS